MRATTFTTSILASMALAALSGAPPVKAADIVIAAGAGAPVHQHIGRGICRAVRSSIGGITCESLRLEGKDQAEPLAVLNNVRNNAVEIGIAPSDWVHHAYGGTGPVKFMDEKFENLRTLFVLHSEPFTVVARRDARIGNLAGLVGKRVNIGAPGTNNRVVMSLVMKSQGWTDRTFQVADELSGAEQSLALCHNRVQATVATLAHPDRNLAKTLDLCGAEIVEVSGAGIDKLVAANPYFTQTEVPGGLYESQEKPVKTFGVRIAAVTSEDISEDTAYAVVKSVFEGLDGFKRIHPALGALKDRDMMSGGLSVPLHAGAIRYFREKGMM